MKILQNILLGYSFSLEEDEVSSSRPTDQLPKQFKTKRLEAAKQNAQK
jgi:hypothetical protein